MSVAAAWEDDSFIDELYEAHMEAAWEARLEDTGWPPSEPHDWN